MFTIPWILSLTLLLIGFIGIVLSAKLLSKPIDEYKFSFTRIFPFEVINASGENSRFYSFSTYLFSGMCFSPILLVISEQTSLKTLNPMSILLACVLGFAGLCFIFLNIFDATHVKAHLSLFTVFAFLILLSATLIFSRGLIAYNIFKEHGKQEYIFLISEILSAITFILVLLLIFNPKLKTWAVLEERDGQYYRPKRFVLAYSEWALLLVLFINGLIYFLQLLVK